MLNLNTASSNCFIRMLELLQIKHSRRYALELYESNPGNDTLRGLTEMFSKYKIQTQCYQFNKEVMLEELPMPFVAIIANEFFTVEELGEEGVLVTFDNRTEVIAQSTFYRGWNRTGLFITEIEHAAEPDLKTNAKKNKIAWIAGALCGCALIYNIAYILVPDFKLTAFLYILTDTAGIYLSWLTLKHSRSEIRKKLCSIFKEANCEKVHKSKASTVFGYPLGVIGITYFTSGLVIELYFQTYINILQFISYGALLFAFWSVLYQKFIIRAWCPVCLLTQLAVIIKAVLFFFTNGKSSTDLYLSEILFILSFFGICFYIIQAFNQLRAKGEESIRMKRELTSIKGNYDIFQYLLEQQERYNTEKCSDIVVGNKNAEHEIVLLMNPYCGPCEMMHRKLERLLINPEILAVFRFRFVFTAFTKQKERVIIAIIGFYLEHTPEQTLNLIHEWYIHKDLEKMLRLYEQYKESSEIRDEIKRQTEWMERSKLTATPYVLFDGYVFPKEYEITDLEYFNI